MKSTNLFKLTLAAAFCILLASPALFAQNLAEFEKKVTEFTLDNGLHFIIIERHEAPVVSFYTHVNVGAVDEPVGNTGLAHIFEHMAFKGDDYIGTTNWAEEKKIIDEMDVKYRDWLEEKYKPFPDSAALATKWAAFEEVQEKSKAFVVNNEFSQIIENSGGTGLNASTGADFTNYFYSLPSNKAELWFSLESGRFKHPTFREFYVEKEVVREERRMRTDSSPIGRLVEEYLAVAYTAHPYGRPVVGWNSDITATTIQDARAFYETHYVPGNITFAIAGDVNPKQMKKFAEEYFGNILGEKKSTPTVKTIEPEQRGERRFTIEGDSQPIMLIGYHTVAETHPDFEALELLGIIISGGRTSVLYKKLVEKEQLALQVSAFNGFPGTRFPSMFVTLAVPNQNVNPEELEARIYEEFEVVKGGSITQDELNRARTQIRAGIIRGLANNMGLAAGFGSTYATTGDWRNVFNQIDRYNEVTLDDLQKVSKKYLTKTNRTVGYTVKKES